MTVDEQGRPQPPLEADEVPTLLGFLDHHRATLAGKCGGLDAAGLSKRLPPSTLTLGGLLKHMALVEGHWLSVRLLDVERHPPFDVVDFDEDPDWEFRTAADDTPEELFALWEEAVDRSRDNVAAALEHGGLDQPLARPTRDGEPISLRATLLHMLEEYARHNGHADLLRENVDGLVGE